MLFHRLQYISYYLIASFDFLLVANENDFNIRLGCNQKVRIVTSWEMC